MAARANDTDDTDDDTEVVLVHSSDVHIDSTDLDESDGYHGLAGLQAVLATAQALAADVLLLAGDTFESHRIVPPVLQRTAALLGAAGLPVVMLPGNHDSILPDCMFRRAGLDALPNVHVLGVTDPDAVLFAAHDLEIRGQALHGDDDMAPLRAAHPRAARWQVVMAHGHYVPPEDWVAESHRAWRISDHALAATRADYVALGHWDRAARVGDGSVPAFYSGSPDLAGTVNVVRFRRTGITVSREPLLPL